MEHALLNDESEWDEVFATDRAGDFLVGKRRKLLGILCVPVLSSKGSVITQDW